MTMTTDTQPGYVAQLVLTVPGRTEPTILTIVLAPTDTVEVDGTLKPLADCTLAELQTAAGKLESDIWETSAAITLLALQEEKQVAVKLLELDEAGQPVAEVDDPMGRIVVLPATAGKAAEPAPDTQTGQQPEAPAAEPPAAETIPAPKPAPAKPAPVVPLHEAVRVLETAEEPEEEAPESPRVIPSAARVRVAGQHHQGGKYSWAAVDVLMDEPPLRAMQAHALSSMDREVAGVVIGARPEKQPDGRYVVHIIDSIAAKYTVMQGASVTYTADSWRYLNDTLAERYPNETAVMVGWYHTHPGFGIFLSGMDQFIHQNFFTQIWHIAYVLDPHARTSGFFCWNREKTKVNRYDFAWPEWAAGSW